MTSLRPSFRPLPWLLAPLLAILALGGAAAQQRLAFDDPGEARRALDDARRQATAARLRGERLEAEAARVTDAAERTAAEAAAIAARIQQGEAEIAGHEARIALLDRQRDALRLRLAEKQRPVVRLTAALQRLSRRPLALSLLRPGSVREAMYMRAILASMLPEVERRTAALRSEIARGRELQRQARLAAEALRKGEGDLRQRRQQLATLETRQRLASRSASGVADRESERALALAEQARDLGALAAGLERAGALREQLARLPGPVLRPPRPGESQVMMAEPPLAPSVAALGAYMLPLEGRLVSGFGAPSLAGTGPSRGIAIAARAGAQAVAPAAGRVAFAGPYRGYGNIVIIEHRGGWTSLVTGLAQLDVRVGQTLVHGAPLGIAGPGRPIVSLELRRGGEPVNPLEYLRAR